MSEHSGDTEETTTEALSTRPSVPVLPTLHTLKFTPCCDTYVRISAVVPFPPQGLISLCEQEGIDLNAARGQGSAVAGQVLSTLSVRLENFEISILRKELCAPARYLARNGKEKSLSTSGSRKDIIPRILAWVQRYLDDPSVPDTTVSAGLRTMTAVDPQTFGVRGMGSMMNTPSTGGKTIRAPASGMRGTGTLRGSMSNVRTPVIAKAAPIAPAYVPGPLHQMIPLRHPVGVSTTPIAPGPAPVISVSTPPAPPPLSEAKHEQVILRNQVEPGSTSTAQLSLTTSPRLPSNGIENATENGGKRPNLNTPPLDVALPVLPSTRPRRENSEKKRRESSDAPTKNQETGIKKESDIEPLKNRDGGTGSSKRREGQAKKESPAKRRKKVAGDKKDAGEKKMGIEKKADGEGKDANLSESSIGRNSAGLDFLFISKNKDKVLQAEVTKCKGDQVEVSKSKGEATSMEGSKTKSKSEVTEAELRMEELALKRADFTMRKEAHDVAMRAAKCMALQKAVALEDECYKLIVEAERVVANAGADATPAMHARVKNLYRKLETVQGMVHD